MRSQQGLGERFRHQPWGMAGGSPGASGQFRLREGSEERRLDDKPGELFVTPEQEIVVETPGAGGYGPPEDRATDAVQHDRSSGKFSEAFLSKHYEQ